MASWYRDGTVSVANGSTSVTGVGTLWVTQVSAGDLITFDAGQRFYEVASVASNTALTLATAYAGTTLSGAAYAVVRNFTSTLPAQLAAEVADLVQSWQTNQDELGDWMAGPSNGGPNGDGEYPLTDPSGTTRTVTGLVRLSEIVGAVNGKLSKSVAGGGAHTLTASEASNGILELTGALTGNKQVVVPAESRSWIVLNKTTGNFSLTVKTPSGTGIVVSRGYADVLVCDGANVLRADSDFRDVALTGTPTAPTPAADTDTPQVATAAHVLASLRRYGLGGGQDTAAVLNNLWTDNDADKVDRTGIYTTSGTTNVPYQTSVLLHAERRFTAGVTALQIAPDSSGGLYFRSAAGAGAGRTWSAWKEIASTAAATYTQAGLVELATSAEVQAGTDATKAVTPASLSARTATYTQAGLVELATTVETLAGTDLVRAVTPVGLSGALGTLIPAASETVAGRVELATNAETQAGTDTTRAVTPAGLQSALANAGTSGAGWRRFPDGYTIETFTATATTADGISWTGGAVVFPRAFTAAPVVIPALVSAAGIDVRLLGQVTVNGITASQISVFSVRNNVNTSSVVSLTVTFVAIGVS